MNGVGGGAASASVPFQLHHNLEQQQRHQQQQPAAATATTPAGPRQQKGAPRRLTYKSCDFCAKRKRKCDGKLPRCSFCIAKKQPHCHYQLKPPTKPRAGKPGAQRRPSTSTSTPSNLSSTSYASSSDVGVGVGRVKRLAGQTSAGCGGDALGARGTRVVALEPGVMTLKRCRLSASPATGMVGMQENAFLSDFFGCLGILPLATESIVRDAMVEILWGAMAPRQQQQHLSLTEGEHDPGDGRGGGHGHGMGGGRPGVGLGLNGRERNAVEMEMERKTDWSSGLTSAAPDENPGKCILWCAIALGALVRGAPIEYVTGYVSLAREALATCFDGSSIENVRAYLMMSFLHGLINDVEKNEKYLSFAVSIVSKLRPEEVPEELGAMILTTEKMKIFQNVHVTGKDDVRAYCSKVVHLPPVGKILEQKDLCNLFLVADRRLNQAFMADMVSQGAIGDDGVVEFEGLHEEVKGQFLDQRVDDSGGGGDGDGDGLARGFGESRRMEEVVGMLNFPSCNLPKPCCGHTDHADQRDPQPCAGPAVKGYIQEVLPELSRLSEALGRSDTTAGIGGVFYHGNVAYMQAVEGKMASSFEALRACADVVLKYPGIVRFRPHLMHCILTASHAWDRSMFEAIRKVYNSIGHLGCRPCPPFEEWGGMRQICDHIFCRSVAREVQLVYRDKRRFESGAASDTDDGGVTDSASTLSSPSPVNLDAVVASVAGAPSYSGSDIDSSASEPGTVMAKPVRTGPILAEADVVVAAENTSFQNDERLDDNCSSSSGTAAGDGAVPDSYIYQQNLDDPVAHRMSEPAPASAPAPSPAFPATATAASVDWPGAGADAKTVTATKDQETVARSRAIEAEAPAGAPAPPPKPVSASMGKESAAMQEDMGMGMDMADADLLDIAAVLMGEEGSLDEL